MYVELRSLTLAASPAKVKGAGLRSAGGETRLSSPPDSVPGLAPGEARSLPKVGTRLSGPM